MTQNLPEVVNHNTPVQPVSLFNSMAMFEDGQRMATMLSQSKMVPTSYQRNLPDCMIVLELAQRIGASPLAVMQNTHVIHGKPGYSAQFIIGMINSCGRYSPLRFEISGEGDDQTCVAWVIEKATGERLESSPVSIKMAKDEGWWSKKDKFGNETSKWQTMPEQMLRYRAATFFGRLYAPELMMGMRAVEELIDGENDNVDHIDKSDTTTSLNERFGADKKKPTEPKAENPPNSKEDQEPGPATSETASSKVDEAKVEEVDKKTLSTIKKRIDKLASCLNIDRFRKENFPQYKETMNGATYEAVSAYASECYEILKADEATAK